MNHMANGALIKLQDDRRFGLGPAADGDAPEHMARLDVVTGVTWSTFTHDGAPSLGAGSLVSALSIQTMYAMIRLLLVDRVVVWPLSRGVCQIRFWADQVMGVS